MNDNAEAMESSSDRMVAASEKIRNDLTTTLQKIGEATNQWNAHNETLWATIGKYESLLDAILKIKAALANGSITNTTADGTQAAEDLAEEAENSNQGSSSSETNTSTTEETEDMISSLIDENLAPVFSLAFAGIMPEYEDILSE